MNRQTSTSDTIETIPSKNRCQLQLQQIALTGFICIWKVSKITLAHTCKIFTDQKDNIFGRNVLFEVSSVWFTNIEEQNRQFLVSCCNHHRDSVDVFCLIPSVHLQKCFKEQTTFKLSLQTGRFPWMPLSCTVYAIYHIDGCCHLQVVLRSSVTRLEQ